MPTSSFTPDESRKLSAVIARTWADADFAALYASAPEAVLAGAGIDLKGRAAPPIPPRPEALGSAAQLARTDLAADSASSISTITCPCTGCTASTTKICFASAGITSGHVDAMMKLSEDPAAREQARKMMSSWDVKLDFKTGA